MGIHQSEAADRARKFFIGLAEADTPGGNAHPRPAAAMHLDHAGKGKLQQVLLIMILFS